MGGESVQMFLLKDLHKASSLIEFCHKVSFEFCHNLIIQVLSNCEFCIFVTIRVLEFFLHLSFDFSHNFFSSIFFTI